MPRLEDSLTVKSLEIRNRIVLPPLTTSFGTADGEVTESCLGFYRQRARDVGLVIVEAAAARPDGRITPFSLGLWDDAKVAGMRTLARAIKEEGAAAAIQVVHAGARAVPVEGGIRGASPSGVRLRPGVEPTILTESQIAEITEDFAAGAERAAEAGFDAIEVHGAHLYLLSQFLSPLTNRREDRYGGDALGRATFALEVVKAIRGRVGPNYVIIFRLNAVELADGGQAIEDGVAAARALEDAGVDVLHASLVAQATSKEIDGHTYLMSSSALPKDRERGAAVPYAAAVKSAVRVPVIAVGKLGEPSIAAKVLAEGAADMVAIGRQMIADPDSAGKMLQGRGEEIILCGECMACFVSLGKGGPVSCATNRDLAGTPRYLEPK
jgi:2,4-dienoyl-CoA reductase-like NADH-dependent reductase (Old Yellow Enzyme family)